MTRLEELTLKVADDSLSSDERAELDTFLNADPQHRATHFDLLQLEAVLRGQRSNVDLATFTLEQIRRELSESLEQGVMRSIHSPELTERKVICTRFHDRVVARMLSAARVFPLAIRNIRGATIICLDSRFRFSPRTWWALSFSSPDQN